MTDRAWLLICFALACMWVGGYAAGRGRPIRDLVAWADWHFTTAPRRSPHFWIAAPIAVIAFGALWVLRPRRSAHNWRAWREHDRRHATTAPHYTPDWAAPPRGHDTKDGI